MTKDEIKCLANKLRVSQSLVKNMMWEKSFFAHVEAYPDRDTRPDCDAIGNRLALSYVDAERIVLEGIAEQERVERKFKLRVERNTRRLKNEQRIRSLENMSHGPGVQVRA